MGDVAAVEVLKGVGDGGKDIGVLVAGIGMECLPVADTRAGFGDGKADLEGKGRCGGGGGACY